MYKLLSVFALGLLASACVPHDAEEDSFIQTTAMEPVEIERIETRPVYVQPAQPQVQPVVVQAPPKETWWQQNKQKHVVKIVAPTCPCKDPNDPCTHCYQK